MGSAKYVGMDVLPITNRGKPASDHFRVRRVRNRAGGKSPAPMWMRLTNSDLSSHAINQLLGIVADSGFKHRLHVFDLLNSF
jgi:hypothetical protein